jgi:hypothetical protein
MADLSETLVAGAVARIGATMAMSAFQKLEEGRMNFKSESGRIGYILLWILGVPIPVLLLIYALRGCT